MLFSAALEVFPEPWDDYSDTEIHGLGPVMAKERSKISLS
jgi:hypothetical protein